MAEEKKKLYLRLVSIFEGDIQVATQEYKKAFILYMKDLEGNEYTCPVCCLPIYVDTIRKSLSRVKPLYLSEEAPKAEPEQEIVDIQNMGDQVKLQ